MKRKIVEREATAYDEKAVQERKVEKMQEQIKPGGCPGKAMRQFNRAAPRTETTTTPVVNQEAQIENQTVAASEYSVRDTIAPAASVTAYLMTPSDSRPQPRPLPAKHLYDLPGYWVLP